jgi:hypothetical protein
VGLVKFVSSFDLRLAAFKKLLYFSIFYYIFLDEGRSLEGERFTRELTQR